MSSAEQGKRTTERSEALRQALSRLDQYRQEIGEFPTASEANRWDLGTVQRCRTVRGDAARASIAYSEAELVREQNLSARPWTTE